MKKLVIIGGVAAGTKAAAKARRQNKEIEIKIYTNEEYISYSACGIPYFIANEFENENRLIVRTKEEFKEKENIDIEIKHEVIEILTDKNKIKVKDLNTGNEFFDTYDKLLIATGATPIKPPIPNIKGNNIFYVRSIKDGIEIKNKIKTSKNAVIIGAGYIGIEMFESFIELGLNTTLVEMSSQILALFDEDIAMQLEKYIKEEIAPKAKGNVNLLKNSTVTRFILDENNNLKGVEINNKEIIDAQIAIVAAGVRPNVCLAKKAGIQLGKTGAIKVNEQMQTNIENIYAAGDCTEKTNMITQKPCYIPLGSTANKEGRVAGINLTEKKAYFKGVLGSAVTRFFDFSMSLSGLTQKECEKEHIDYEYSLLPANDRAGYMKNSNKILIKLIANKKTRKIIGVQAIGKGDADKRVNTIATAMCAGLTIEEFLDTDLTYAPPYSKAIDPILTSAQILQSKLKGEVEDIDYQTLQKKLASKEELIMLCTDEHECTKLPAKEAEVVLYCESGLESYIKCKELKKQGFKNVKFLKGGKVCLNCKD